jgi:hypothetical protein
MWKDSCPVAARPLMGFVAWEVSEKLSYVNERTYNEHVDALSASSNYGSNQGQNRGRNHEPDEHKQCHYE